MTEEKVSIITPTWNSEKVYSTDDKIRSKSILSKLGNDNSG